MHDEKSGTSAPEPVASSASSAPEPATPGTIMGVPLESFVRGQRSRPAAHDRMIVTEEADAEKRRDVAAEERAAAKVPIAQGGGMMYENRFQDSNESAASYFELRYVDRRGGPRYLQGQELGGLADVQALPDGSVQVLLICPRCKEEGLPLGQCSMTVNTRNKKIDIDFSTAGEMILFDDGFGMRAYRSAGTIRETDRFDCYQCNAGYRIVKNRVLPEL